MYLIVTDHTEDATIKNLSLIISTASPVAAKSETASSSSRFLSESEMNSELSVSSRILH